MVLILRHVREEDLLVFFEHQRDPEAVRMAAFPSRAWDVFEAHWRSRVFGDATAHARTVVLDDRVAGYVVTWERDGVRLLGLWLGREHWGRGVAPVAVAAFLREHEHRRPIQAYVARSNTRSIRVLEKCGFRLCSDSVEGADGVAEVLFRFD
jgi:RimJ/RimL family protein N-acetyltransferase